MDDEALQAVFWQAIDNLPWAQREVVLLADGEDLSLAEIAIIVEADLELVAWRLAQGRKRLQVLLAPYLGVNDKSALLG